MNKRALRFLLLPIAVFLWIGWVMSWVGYRKQEHTQQKPPKKTSESDLVAITALIPKEVEENEA